MRRKHFRIDELGAADRVRDLYADGLTYEEIAEKVSAEFKTEIGKSSVHRFLTDYREIADRTTALMAQATALARELSEQDITDTAAIAEVLLLSGAQQRVMELTPADFANVSPEKLSKIIERIARTQVYRERYREEIGKKLAKLETEDGEGKKRLDPETLRRVREELYGVV